MRAFLTFTLFTVTVGLALSPALAVRPNESTTADGERIAKLIAQLGSERPAEREEAGKALEAIGRPALEALRNAAGGPDQEMRQRAEALVKKIEEGPIEVNGIKVKIVSAEIIYDAPKEPGDFSCTIRAEIENRTDKKLILPKPTLMAGKVTFQPGRSWYGEKGEQWDGSLRPGEKKTCGFSGEWNGKKREVGGRGDVGDFGELKIIWGPSMIIRRKVIVERTQDLCTCGCTRSEAMAAELRQQGGEAALAAIDKALAEIAARAKAGAATEKMMEHRSRLQKLAEEIRENSPRGP